MFEGVLADNVLAFMWWNLAVASGGESAAKNKDIVSKHMTMTQIEKAQKLSRECFNREYKYCV